MGAFLNEWWHVLIGALGGFGWLVRLESRTTVLERDQERQEKETKEMLREIRDDIKDLIKRTS